MNKLLTLLLILISYINLVKADDFFQDITYQVLDNQPRLSYGVSVSDANNDGKFEFIVTGFGFNNLALGYKKGILFNTIDQGPDFTASHRKSCVNSRKFGVENTTQRKRSCSRNLGKPKHLRGVTCRKKLGIAS